MQKLLFGIFFLVLVLVFPLPARAGVDVGVNISLPLPIVFVAPPQLIVLPETDIYVVPAVEVDIFFYDGWWWRPWEGGWYRSRHYDSGWSYYEQVPSFYSDIPSNWRNEYREHRWRGNQWNYQPIPHQEVQQNWSVWQKSGYWEKQQTWGVKGLQPRMRSKQPSREVQQKTRQAQPQLKAVKPQRSQQHQGEGKKVQKAQPQHSQPQKGSQKGGKGEAKGKK